MATAPRGIAARNARATAISRPAASKDVHFEDAADAALNDAIDAAYRSKYLHHGAQWVDPMVAAEARSTTIKLVPR